jgi:hypothetical protein
LGCAPRARSPAAYDVEFASDSPPPELALPDLADYQQPNAILLVGRVFPVGWSPHGLFAYGYEPPDEACDCYRFELVVLDLATTQSIWEYRYDSSAREPHASALISLADVWQAHGAELGARLEAFGIAPHAETSLTKFARQGRAWLDANVGQIRRSEPSAEGNGHIFSYELELSSSNGARRILPLAPTAAAQGPLSVSSLGYLRSPHEPWLAVLIQETFRGWEGRPYVATFRFAGAEMGPP